MSKLVKELVFEAPTPQTPGYLRRLKKGLDFRKKLQDFDVSDSAWISEMIDFLVGYVTEPEDREEAKEAMWDVTEDKYNDMLNAIIGKQEEGEENPTVAEIPLVKSEPPKKAE